MSQKLFRGGVPVDEHVAWGDWIDPSVVPASGPPEEIAAGVALLLSQVSEEADFAGWLTGTEFNGWAWAHGLPAYRPECVTPEVVEALARGARLLAGGWVAWDDLDGPVLVDADEWARLRAGEGG